MDVDSLNVPGAIMQIVHGRGGGRQGQLQVAQGRLQSGGDTQLTQLGYSTK